MSVTPINTTLICIAHYPVSDSNTRLTTADTNLWQVESKVTSIFSVEDITLLAICIKHIPSKVPNLPANLTMFEKLAV